MIYYKLWKNTNPSLTADQIQISVVASYNFKQIKVEKNKIKQQWAYKIVGQQENTNEQSLEQLAFEHKERWVVEALRFTSYTQNL